MANARGLRPATGLQQKKVNFSRLKILFVCAMNKQRSVTAERIYRNDARLEVRSAGVRSGAKRRVSEEDLVWADVVYVMERDHKLWITMRFEEMDLPIIDVLDIPDNFVAMDPELQDILRSLLDPEIAHRLRDRPLRKRPTNSSRPTPGS